MTKATFPSPQNNEPGGDASAQLLAALEQRLSAMGDEAYKAFNEGLVPNGINQSLGVRIPALRAVAKELCRGDWRAFLDGAAVRESQLHEIILLRGVVTATAKCGQEERLRRTAEFIPSVNNWAVNDTVCASYRIPAAQREAWKAFLTPYIMDDAEFSERFALILLMDQFLTDDSVDFVLDACAAAKCTAYYTRMAVAWAVCTAFCKYRDKTLAFLQGPKGRALDAWTVNKAVQKCRESFRISPEDKQLLLSLKRTL